MEDAAKADEPGADGAEQKKQYLLDRIATSDGFKDAKAHKEEDAPAAAAGREGHRGSVVRRGRVAAEAPTTFTGGQPGTARAPRVEIWRARRVEGERAGRARRRAGERGERGLPGRRRRRRSHHQCRRRFIGGEARGAAVPRGQRLAALRDRRRGGHQPAGPSGPCDATLSSTPSAPITTRCRTARATSWQRGDALLRSAYVSMARAKEEKCKTVAFSLLSAGIFRGRQSLDTILAISVGAVADGAYEGLERVHLVAFTPASSASSRRRRRRGSPSAHGCPRRPRRREGDAIAATGVASTLRCAR